MLALTILSFLAACIVFHCCDLISIFQSSSWQPKLGKIVRKEQIQMPDYEGNILKKSSLIIALETIHPEQKKKSVQWAPGYFEGDFSEFRRTAAVVPGDDIVFYVDPKNENRCRLRKGPDRMEWILLSLCALFFTVSIYTSVLAIGL